MMNYILDVEPRSTNQYWCHSMTVLVCKDARIDIVIYNFNQSVA